MIDLFGTPYTASLHVVERYQLVNFAGAKADLERQAKENWRPGGPVDPNYKDKFLKIEFTIDDPGAFTTPWTATMIYLRDNLEWPEVVCAENPHVYYGQDEKIPVAERPDF